MPAEDCQVQWVVPHAVVVMPAEIDAVNAERIRQDLLSAVSLGAAVVVIDMSGTTFCDSAGVQPIIAAYRQAAATGTQLPLVATAVLRILTLVGAGQLLPIYPTLEAALAGTPPAHASTPDPGDEHGGTTASGDPQAQTPPAEAQHSGQPRLRRERGGWLAEDLPERSVCGLKFERDQDRPIATDRDLAGVAGGALAAVGSPHILIAPGRDLNQR